MKTALLSITWATLAILPQAIYADDSVPQYKLVPGQELFYTSSSEFNYDGGSLENELQWKVWVSKTNEDGSWRLIARHTQKSGRGSDPRVTMAYFDLFPDGRIIGNSTLGYMFDPAVLFLQLPGSASEIETGWKSLDKSQDLRRIHRTVSCDAESLVVEVENKSPLDAIYMSSSKATITFDRQRGIVQQIESQTTQGYGFNGKGTGKTVLKSVTTRDAKWTENLATEASICFEAEREYQEVLKQAQLDTAKTAALLDQAEAVLVAARQKVSVEELKAQLDSQVKSHTSMASYFSESAKRRAKVVGKPAYDFTTTDLQGNSHALKQYRGKVVVLDFWYRGCGWCIRAMPQVKEVAKAFEDRPVVVFGMNTDRVEEDALFVVEKMGLTYANLKAKGLPEKYSVQGFPTLIIIDRKGIVREFHVGYSADLAETVMKDIEELLAES